MEITGKLLKELCSDSEKFAELLSKMAGYLFLMEGKEMSE